MNRYILIPEDTIRVLPPEDGVEAAVEVFCSRTVIFFDISQKFEIIFGFRSYSEKVSERLTFPTNSG